MGARWFPFGLPLKKKSYSKREKNLRRHIPDGFVTLGRREREEKGNGAIGWIPSGWVIGTKLTPGY